MKNLFFILIFILNYILVYSQCLTKDSPNMESNLPSARHSDGVRYINLYIHLVKTDDCSQGPTVMDAGIILNKLNSYFNPVNIYFNLACIKDFCKSDCYLDNLAIPSYYPTNSISNALNLYLTNGSNGKAFSTLSNNCYSGIDGELVTHELGHCLGLLHTDIGGECVTRDENNPHFNCNSTGDKICDTEADNQDVRAIVGCTWDIALAESLGIKDACENRVYQMDPTLIMRSAFIPSCTDLRFTLNQGTKMRNNIYAGVVGPSADQYLYSGFYIQTPTGWQTPQKFNVDVIVASTLHISNTTVEMAPNRKIILLDGANLIVNNSKITIGSSNNCESNTGIFWKGIEIHSSSSQTSVNITNNSIIEKAESGLYLATPTDILANIIVENSLFINNWRAMSLVSKSIATKPVNLLNINVEITPDYLGTSYSRQFYLANYNLLGTSVHFKNTKNINELSAGGIYSYNGALTLDGNSTQEGFIRGIEANSMGSQLPVILKNFTSSKSANHVEVKTRYSNNFSNCFINVGDRLNISSLLNRNFGIRLEHTRGNTVQNNTFTDFNDFSGSRTGFQISETGDELQIIGPYNSFTDFNTAASAGNFNRGTSFLCNYHVGNERDFDWSTIFKDQGSSSKPAGNTFSVAASGSSDVNISSILAVNYFFGNGPGENPLSINNKVTKIPVQKSGCLHNISAPSDDIVVLNNDYLIYKSQLNNLELTASSTNFDSTSALGQDILAQVYDKQILIENVINQAIRIISYYEDKQIYQSQMVIWLQRINSFDSYSAIAYMYLMNHQYVDCFSTLNNIPILFTLNQDQIIELNSMYWLIHFMKNIYVSGKWEGELSTIQIDSLITYASNNSTKSGQMARNILEFFYDIYISDNNSFSKKYKSNNEINSGDKSKLFEELSIYPNPAEDHINIVILKPVANEIMNFQIKDIFGNIKQKGEFKKEFEQINIKQLNSGIYYIHLILNDKIISTKKFIKK